MLARLSTTVVCSVALAIAAGASAAKLVVLAQSPSSALFSSTAQSLIEASYLGLLLLGMHQAGVSAGRDAGEKAGERAGGSSYFWSFVVAILLYAMGAGVALHEGVERIAKPFEPVRSGFEVLVLAVAVAAAAAVCLLASETRPGERSAGEHGAVGSRGHEQAPHTALLAVSMGSVAGQVLALGGILTATSGGDVRSDAMASIAVGLTMAAVAAFMAIEVRRALAEPAIASTIAELRPALDEGDRVFEELPAGLETKSATVEAVPVVEEPWRGEVAEAARPSPPATSAARPARAGDTQKPLVQVRQGGRKGRGKHRR